MSDCIEYRIYTLREKPERSWKVHAMSVEQAWAIVKQYHPELEMRDVGFAVPGGGEGFAEGSVPLD